MDSSRWNALNHATLRGLLFRTIFLYSTGIIAVAHIAHSPDTGTEAKLSTYPCHWVYQAASRDTATPALTAPIRTVIEG